MSSCICPSWEVQGRIRKTFLEHSPKCPTPEHRRKARR